MKFFVFFIIIIAVLIGLNYAISLYPGSLMIDWLGYHITCSLDVALLCFIGSVFGVWGMATLVIKTIKLPLGIGAYFKNKRIDKQESILWSIYQYMRLGLWSQAEAQFNKLADFKGLNQRLKYAFQLETASHYGQIYNFDLAENYLKSLDKTELFILYYKINLLKATTPLNATNQELILKLYDRLVQLEPCSVLYLAYAQQLVSFQDYDKALSLLKLISSQDREYIPACHLKLHLALQLAQHADQAGNIDKALTYCEIMANDSSNLSGNNLLSDITVIDTSQDYQKLILLHSNLYYKRNKPKQALRIIEQGWRENPYRQFFEQYLLLSQSSTQDEPALNHFKLAQRLASFNPNHLLSQEIIIESALKAKLWGYAQTQLQQFQHTFPDEKLILSQYLQQLNHHSKNKVIE